MDDNDLQLQRVNEIAAISDETGRMGLIGAFIEDYSPQIDAIARRLSVHYRCTQRYDDIRSIVLNTAFEELVKATVDNIHNWGGWLSFASDKAVSKMLDEDRQGGLSKTGTRQRRVRAMARTRDRLARDLGHEPTPEQVVDTYNASVRATQNNPEKHGAIATVDDFTPIMAAEMPENTIGSAASLADAVCIETVQAIITACAEVGDDVACVAERWLLIEEGVLDIEDRPKVLSEDTMISIRKIPALLAEAKRVAAEVMLAHLAV